MKGKERRREEGKKMAQRVRERIEKGKRPKDS
jgi:hypothetical protein